MHVSPPPARLPVSLAAAAPLAFGLAVLSELVALSVRDGAGATGSGGLGVSVGALGELAEALYVTAPLTLALLLGQVAALTWWSRHPRHVVAAASAVFLLSVAQGGVILARLVANTEVADHGHLWVVTLGFGSVQGFVLVAIGSIRRLRLPAIVVFFAAALGAFYVNYLWIGSFYLPSDALTLVVFVALLTAIALVAKDENRMRVVLLAGGVVALVWGPGLFLSTLRADASRAVYLYTATGHTLGLRNALAVDDAALRPRVVAPRTLEPAPDGPALFAEHSGLPALPDDFTLADHDVVLILSEAFRYDETSLADPSLDTTPNLAEFARRGISFSRATSPSNATYSSLTSLLAMQTPSFAPLDVPPSYWTGKLREEGLVAPEIFSSVGYDTFWVGHNFNNVFGTALLGVRRRFDEVDLVRIDHHGPSTGDREIADAAVASIARHRASGRRFFGLIFLSAPHDSYRAHDPDQPAGTKLERYRQELRFMDTHLGRILEALSRDGGDEQTVVIISGDHGEAFGDHGFDYHATTVHRAQTHVPLVVVAPDVEPRTLDGPTAAHFVLPWLLQRGPPQAAEEAERLMREDYGPLFRETGGAVITEMVSLRYQRAALRYPTHTVIYDMYGDVSRIYDVADDPAELHDLAPLQPELARRYRPFTSGYRRARFAGQRFRFTIPVPSRR